ncbi:MAG: serine hydrolase domain-containing protein [Myxococcota bacterium]
MIRGEIHPDFWGVARALERQVRGAGGGAAVCVYFRGQPVVDIWAGTRDEEGRPWEHETMAMSFSTSKGVTATALHRLADRGLLDYDDPVAKYWPEFDQNGKAPITIRHLLSHQAGLYHIRQLIDHGERILDWDHMVGVLAKAKPAMPPGSASAYHALTFGWLVGEVIQRVAKRPFSEVIQTELAEPLHLDGLHIGTPRELQKRAAHLPLPRRRNFAGAARIGRAFKRINRALRIPFDPEIFADAMILREGGDVLWHPDVLTPPIPAVNGLFTARSLARMYAALAGGGELDGVRFLSSKTLDAATRIQSRRMDRALPIRMHWRLGYHRVFTTRGTLRHAFGHYGYGGSGAFADPERNLAVAMINNRAGGTPFGDSRTASIAAAAARSADRARR